MDHILIILHRDDIGPAQQLAATLEAFQVYTFDPILLDRILAAGLGGARYLQWEQAPSFNTVDAAAHAAASAFEAALAPAVQAMAPDLSLQGWQHYNLYYLFSALMWHKGLWPAVGPQLKGKHLHVFCNDNPLAYYFNSFVPASMLLDYAAGEQIACTCHVYGAAASLAQHVPNLETPRAPSQLPYLAVHLPTCMYDYGYFNSELDAHGRYLLNLHGKYFNVPLQSDEVLGTRPLAELLPLLPAPWAELLASLRERLSSVIAAQLRPYLRLPQYCTRQEEHLTGIYCAQLATLGLLDRYFAAHKPLQLVLADHDTDFHGPLLAFAQRYQLPVLYLPHSKTTSDIFFANGNLTCLTHPIQGDAIQAPGGRLARQARLAFPEAWQFAALPGRRLRRVGILLQAASLGGVYTTDMRPYLEGLKQLVQWCRAEGLEFTLRGKPSYLLLSLLSSELGLSEAELMAPTRLPMPQYAAGCDLCLMYDAPTSAELDFLGAGVAILNPVIKDLTNVEAMVADPAIIPRASVAQTLRHATQFLRDPASLEQFRARQFASYAAAWREARPLRSYLL